MGEPVENQLEISLANYYSFLDQIWTSGRKKIVVFGAPPPTLKDGENTQTLGLRGQINVPLVDRTRLVQEFNRRLSEHCRQRAYRFFSIGHHVINTRTEVVDDRFVNPCHADHHLHGPAVADFILRELRALGIVPE
jgi:hypothetical protein